MKDSDGNWIEEPPLHEPIVAEGNDWGKLYLKMDLFGPDKNSSLFYMSY